MNSPSNQVKDESLLILEFVFEIKSSRLSPGWRSSCVNEINSSSHQALQISILLLPLTVLLTHPCFVSRIFDRYDLHRASHAIRSLIVLVSIPALPVTASI